MVFLHKRGKVGHLLRSRFHLAGRASTVLILNRVGDELSVSHGLRLAVMINLLRSLGRIRSMVVLGRLH